MLFDTKDNDFDFPIAAPLPLPPFVDDTSIELCMLLQPNLWSRPETFYLSLDSDTWRFHQPDIIIDTEKGYQWRIGLDLAKISLSFGSKVRLVSFLVRRRSSRRLLLALLRSCILEGGPLSLLSKMFDVINTHYHNNTLRANRYILTPRNRE